jgi:hypothetical protein
MMKKSKVVLLFMGATLLKHSSAISLKDKLAHAASAHPSAHLTQNKA